LVTGNGNVVAKTGNIYISGTMTYTNEILKVNLGFSITSSSKKNCPWAIATTTNNLKWQYIRAVVKELIAIKKLTPLKN